MKDLKNLKLKKAFLYNDDLYRNLNINFFIKKIIIILVLGVYVYCYFKYYLYNSKLNFDTISSEQLFIYFALLIGTIISLFFIIYHIISLGLTTMDDAIFSNRCYLITEDNRFLTVKFENPYYVRTPSTNGNIFLNILKLIFIKVGVSIQKENLKINIEETLKTSEILVCMEVNKVYEVKQKRKYIDIKCDCHNLITNEYLQETEISIYKYFDNWEEIIMFINKNLKNDSFDNNKSKEFKKTNLDKYESSLVNKLPRLGYFFPVVFNFVYLYGNGFDETMIPFSLIIGLPFLLISLFYEKKFLNEINNEEINKLLDKKLKKDRIITSIYFFIIVIFMIIFYKCFLEILISLIISLGLTAIIILKLKKK